MATRATQTSQGRQNSYGNSGLASGGMDVGNSAITRMAREDTRWFVIAVVVLSLVLFFALPLSLLIYVDTAKMQAEVRAEVKQLKRLRKELEKTKEE